MSANQTGASVRLVLAIAAAVEWLTAPVAQGQWVAFNDQGWEPAHTNVTSYTLDFMGVSWSGPLRDIETGTNLPAVLGLSYHFGDPRGLMATGPMGAPARGTPADAIFAPYINWTDQRAPGIAIGAYDSATYHFSGLDPNKEYRFIGGGIRGGSVAVPGNEYSNRWTMAELVGAVSYAPAHPVGVLTSNEFPGSLNGSQAAWNAGLNTNGAVIEWNHIKPSLSGTFSVYCLKYGGSIPGGSAANGQTSYLFQAIRLEELGARGVIQIAWPTNYSVVLTPANLFVAAVLSGFGRPVRRVAFYNGPDRLAEVAGPPYSFTWSNVPAGSLQLSAQAMDDSGILAKSEPVNITALEKVHIGGIAAQADGSLVIKFGSVAGVNYIIEYSEDLIHWQEISVPLAGQGSLEQLVVRGARGKGFYRIRL